MRLSFLRSNWGCACLPTDVAFEALEPPPIPEPCGPVAANVTRLVLLGGAAFALGLGTVRFVFHLGAPFLVSGRHAPSTFDTATEQARNRSGSSQSMPPPIFRLRQDSFPRVAHRLRQEGCNFHQGRQPLDQ